MNFELILGRIAGGEDVSSSELLPYLCLERKSERANANAVLARAYWQSGREDHRWQAKVFIGRAWLLSEFSPELLPLFVKIHAALDDIDAIREAYKRLGMVRASRGDVAETIKYFDLWQYSYVQFKNIEKVEYDFDILDCIKRLALPFRFSPKKQTRLPKDKQIKVAYLVHGITELGSVLVRINLLYARLHDRSRVEPTFYVPETEAAVLASVAGREHLRLFESFGCPVVTAPNLPGVQEELLAVADRIHQDNNDILVTCAALAHFDHYFITCLKPAPTTIAFVQGNPEQFSPPSVDWGIAWSLHPMIDSPLNCLLVNNELELSGLADVAPISRRELAIPADVRIIASAGRFHKFQNLAFWKALIDLLNDHSDLYYLAIGVNEGQVPFLAPMLSEEIRARIRFLTWRGKDYLRTLCLADILIDTYPSGGGATIVDAMAMGIPVVVFENDYMKRYDPIDWSPAEEILTIPELIVPRGDFAQMSRTVESLLSDRTARLELGQRSKDLIQQTKGNPERGVRRCEDIYFQVLEEKFSGRQILNERAAEVNELANQLVRYRIAPSWVASIARKLKRSVQYAERILDRISEGRMRPPD